MREHKKKKEHRIRRVQWRTATQKDALRARRAKKHFDEVVAKREKTTQHIGHADFSKYTQRNVECSLKEQGGKDSEAALKATATLVKRCLHVCEP